MPVRLTINGKPFVFDGDPAKPLLWVIREDAGLTGTKYGCGVAACGACTVHLDGVATRSCSVPVEAAAGSRVVTIEGLAAGNGNERHPLQQAWIEAQVPQCGYCQSGMIMAAAALLAGKPTPDRRRHRRGDDEPVPLRDLSARACGDPCLDGGGLRRS